MIKVLIVDDEKLLRESIKFRVGFDNDIEVIGTASNGREAVEFCETLLPDVVLMDVVMPECDGIEATKLIKSKFPNVKVIILTTFNTSESVSNAIANGADCYVLKDIDPSELCYVIRSTINGLKVFHEDAFLNVNSLQDDKNCAEVRELLGISDRELEIIQSIVQGMSTEDISSQMFLSEGRIKAIIGELFEKLNVKDRVQLAVFAVRNGLA